MKKLKFTKRWEEMHINAHHFFLLEINEEEFKLNFGLDEDLHYQQAICYVCH